MRKRSKQKDELETVKISKAISLIGLATAIINLINTIVINVIVMGSLFITLAKLERRLRDDKRKENRENNSLSH